MAEIVSSDERLRAGEAALARGAWAEARAIFERELEGRETVDALEGLSWAAWWVEDVPTCIDARERAFRLSRREGDVRRAAMLALWVGDDYLILRGERAIANGWFRRAARILEGLDSCPEQGWLDALLGYVATIDGDLEEAKELAIEGRVLGQQLGVVSLEMFALAVEGLALVNEGEIANGMRCLDEATAAALAGEFEEIVAAGWTFCFLLNACERVRDFERAAEWCRRVEEFSRRTRTNFVTLACRAHYGAVLTWHGRWSEAEKSLTEAERLALERPSWGGLAIVRLADLRRRQGRFAEAEELLRQRLGNPLTPVVMAELALDRGDPSAAVDLLEPVLRRLPVENQTLRAAPLEVLVRAKVATGAADAAASHVTELRAIADALGTRPLQASLSLSEGLVAAAAGDHETARARLEDAVELFAASGASFELARARLELARLLASLGRADAAVREAQDALTRVEEIGAVAEAARARELLRALGASPKARRAVGRDAILTRREVEILRLVAEGLTDGDIAARLVLSKHTVHRHLQNAYAKLGCSSRVAAVTRANKLHLL
jgi:LuxR family maltose regulon positive regulatory protein